MRKNRLLYFSWIIVLLIIVKIGMDKKPEDTSFQGIAESREVIVNSEKAVEIKKIHVSPGQVIRRGSLLVELERPELTLKINEISYELEEIKLQDDFDREAVRSRINQLKAEKRVVESESELKISQLRSRLDFNKKVAAGLGSITKDSTAKSTPNPMNVEIQGLTKDLRLKCRRIQLQIDALAKQLASTENPVAVRTESLEKELSLLLEEKKDLLVYARIDAVVGSVLCKVGEKISPFVPIVTLYKQSPTYVKAYIHEKFHHEAQTGQNVEIVSLSASGKRMVGEIIGTGSRIVEYPVRLRKRPEVQIWGREVDIRLPEDNDFLLGEKVMVYSMGNSPSWTVASIRKRIRQWFNLDLYAAENRNPDPPNSGAIRIRASKSLGSIPQIEASGLIFLSEIDRFLLVSDETKKKRPILYLMDSSGFVSDQVVVQGVETMDDMEAICTDANGNIYIACSQSLKKNGDLPDCRKRLVRVRRTGTDFEATGEVLLFDLLKGAADKYSTAQWTRMLAEQNIEIEGIFHKDRSLYLGWKTPLKDGRSLILRIADIEKVFRENRMDGVSVWRTPDLRDPGQKTPVGITDLFESNGRLYVLSTAKHREPGEKTTRTGTLRIFDPQGSLLKLIRFDGLNPEGVTLDTIRNEIVITFDEGKKHPSKMTRIKNII